MFRALATCAAPEGRTMRRRFAAVLTLLGLVLGLALTLAGCDKCGGFQEIRYPSLPHACRGDAPAR